MTYQFVAGAGAVGPEGRPPLVHSGLPTGDCKDGGLPVLPGREQAFTPAPGLGIAFPEATRNTLMSATIVATGGPVGVSVRAFTSDSTFKEASYEGFDVTRDLGTDISVPLALKTVDGYYTQILFSNPNRVPTEVTIVYSGNTGTHEVKRNVGPFGVLNHSTYSDNVVPAGFIGAAVVKSTQPIAVVTFRAKKVDPRGDLDEDLYTAWNGIPSAKAARTLAFPLIVRRFDRDASHDGVNSWISVSVPGGGVANLTIRAVGTCSPSGPDVVYTTTRRITGSFVFYQNAETDTGLGANPPPCFYGTVTITSDAPILGVASYLTDRSPGDGEAVYNAVTP